MIYDHEESIKVISPSSNGNYYRKTVVLKYKNNYIYIFSPYDKYLIGEIKVMEGAKWLGFEKPPIKAWRVANSVRNHFALSFLKGENPYSGYRRPLDPWISKIKDTCTRPLYDHQVEMIAQVISRHYVIIAAEMGTGKTLAVIEAAEREDIKAISIFDTEFLYVGPKSGVVAVEREFIKWQSALRPRMMTYEKLVSAQQNQHYPFKQGMIPRYVVFDESSKIKTPTSKRSKAAFQLAELVRDTYGQRGYVILMSGTPAPRVPTDWWQQSETACPGFIREGNIHQFKKRLCIIEERESISGGVYPHIVAWLDDEKKCSKCGQFKTDPIHNQVAALTSGAKYHQFVASRNEVQYLYERMKGLVLVKMKKDCLDLPEKQYKEIMVRPTVETMRMANMITRTSSRAIAALSLLRELSDGFQYYQEEMGVITCPMCSGSGKTAITPTVEMAESFDNENYGFGFIDEGTVDTTSPDIEDDSHRPCPQCGGKGKVKKYARSAKRIHTPKDDVLGDMLDDAEDIGRIVIWGGFTETIDKIVDQCHKKGWHTLRVDGRGYKSQHVLGEVVHDGKFLDAMDASHPNRTELLDTYPKIAFVGHPKAGGMALTLTASPIALYYSNTFDGEARMQSEDRIHRAGMDVNRGCTIIDLIHLPSDKLVLDNLKRKKRLQNMTMTEVQAAINNRGE